MRRSSPARPGTLQGALPWRRSASGALEVALPLLSRPRRVWARVRARSSAEQVGENHLDVERLLGKYVLLGAGRADSFTLADKLLLSEVLRRVDPEALASLLGTTPATASRRLLRLTRLLSK